MYLLAAAGGFEFNLCPAAGEGKRESEKGKMLSNNNMLTVGGGSRQRQRGTVRVSEPSKGFFITGSSIAAMNGVYVRRNPPRTRKEGTPIKSLYYEHEEGTWHMILQELLKPEVESDDDDEFDDYYSRFRRREKRKKTHEWVFTDEFDVERFVHDGDTIIPGAGVRWKHVHKEKPAAEEPTLLSSMFGASATSTQVVEIKEDDEEELPWQVIAILDEDMVEQVTFSFNSIIGCIVLIVPSHSEAVVGQHESQGENQES